MTVLTTLKRQVVLETSRGGQATVHDRCEVKLMRADLACTGHAHIVRRATCREALCWNDPDHADCKKNPSSNTRQVFAWEKVGDTYQQQKKLTPVRDGKPWAVVHASIDLDSPGGKKKAARLRDKLRKAGYATAQVVDGQHFSRFRCCYWVVLVHRVATRAAALELVRQLKKKKISAYARRAY